MSKKDYIVMLEAIQNASCRVIGALNAEMYKDIAKEAEISFEEIIKSQN